MMTIDIILSFFFLLSFVEVVLVTGGIGIQRTYHVVVCASYPKFECM
jgi:hypothetical protein